MVVATTGEQTKRAAFPSGIPSDRLPNQPPASLPSERQRPLDWATREARAARGEFIELGRPRLAVSMVQRECGYGKWRAGTVREGGRKSAR